jgi:hypothetical protein
VARARVGDLSPQRYTYRLYKDDVPWLELSDIDSCVLSVRKPSGAEQTWTSVLETYDSSLGYRQGSHLYLAGELNEAGDYSIKPIATVSADATGPVQWPVKPLKVWAEFE